MIPLLLRCIAKGLECQSLRSCAIEVLTIAESSKWKEKLLEKIISLPYDDDDDDKIQQIILDAVIFFKAMAEKMPEHIVSLLGMFAGLNSTITRLKDLDPSLVNDDVWEKFQECMEIKDFVMNRRERQLKRKQQDSILEEEPPDDFREIPVYPVSADLAEDSEKKLHLRRIKTKGKYNNNHNYLDVQFRLLREDFICPLREGIKEFKRTMATDGKVKKMQELRIYDNVYIISPKSTKSGLSYRVSFDTEKLQRVRWEVSKRLIFGSLVALSPDNFETLIFATVAERDPKKMKDGIVDLKIETSISEVDVSAFSRDTAFVMAETTAYFEAYKHVLAGLQNIDEKNLPFERYIVNCEKDVHPPAYLERNPKAKYDLRPLIDEHIILRGEKRGTRLGVRRTSSYDYSFQSECAKAVNVMRDREWPTAKQLHLDDSQFRAVQSALTREFVITQGPPGTGKTYIGLKIVKALLHNYSIWNEAGTIHRPMLVVCYTNHALDQFLEGILDFYKGDVVRVGGRSSSEKLKEKKLADYRAKLRSEKSVPYEIYRARRQAREELTGLSERINRISSEIENVEREIVHEDALQPFMRNFYRDLVSGLNEFLNVNGYHVSSKRRQRASAIVEWLGYGSLINVLHGDTDIHLHAGVEMLRMREAQAAQNDDLDQNSDDGMIDVDDEVDQMASLRELDSIFDDILRDSGDSAQRLSAMMTDMNIRHRTVAMSVTNFEHKDEDGWQISKNQRKRMKQTLRRELRSSDRMSLEEISMIEDVWDLTLKDKWRLYRYWTKLFSDSLKEKIKGTEQALERASSRHQDILMQEDKEVMRRATVIGLTTTAAARYQSVLLEIGPRIIVVEEAAEVLEGHVITNLSPECQHLILIGDHKQLKPNPTVYKLAKNYNLDLSLFERMINNNMDYECLKLQHRMRPQISGMMKIIYPELKDHEVVLKYPNIKGVRANMFFIDHEYPEKMDEDQRSHSNEYEAKYIVALCRYLLLQGYNPSQITILTLYTGQLFELRSMLPKQEFQGVRVTVVDNFQGEENDIVLMSLVRSNEGKIGFLEIENRVCVALSRAKHGFFVIGNLKLMAKKSKLWKKVIYYAKRENAFGDGLYLQCQNHPNDAGIFAEKPSDFQKAPMGGCMKPCEFRLRCGHTCAQVCHIIGADHKDYRCRKPCKKKICDNKGHRCKKLCYQNCGDCTIPVEKLIPRCGHKDLVPCYLDPNKHSCRYPCQKFLPCGHQCTNLCGETHIDLCMQQVLKGWSCGHKEMVRCHKKDTALCSKKCEEILKCGHPCKGSCGECYIGRLHISCLHKCDRPLVCEHQCTDYCSLCPPCKRPCQNRCKHSKCQNICGELCTPCMEPCEWRCHHYVCTNPCGEPCNRKRCNRPCRNVLPCGHRCIGLCGEPCPKYCRVCDADIVQEIFFGAEDEPDALFVQLEDCGHIIEYTAMDIWMESKSEADSSAIQLRCCPRCKTAIRKNLRYGNIVKRALRDIEKVKRIKQGDEKRIKELKRSIPVDIKFKLTGPEKYAIERLYETVVEYGILTESELVAIDTRIRYLEKIAKTETKWEEPEYGKQEYQKGMEAIKILKQWIIRDRKTFSEQEVEDLQNEFDRITSMRIFVAYIDRMRSIGYKPSDDLAQAISRIKKILFDGTRLTEKLAKVTNAVFKVMKAKIPMSGLGISEKERVEILQAVGLSKGHWYKCPKGHIYAIGECGGANQGGRCPECGSAIGGQNHALATGNQVATEMDGARYAAWSEQANMANFDPNEFR
ncbi:hypothetical protein FSP39_010254 [Pinctada imbricata]|uniref:RZ-type domain-containing protein n=1 Tax=Pinctada imbricata TaxID=66713 RepID=A0AA88XZM9_PINIB|nr:hypothetical protein FSP39_010254 [Pinctada imbricata]